MIDQAQLNAADRLVIFLNSRGVGFTQDADLLDTPDTYSRLCSELLPEGASAAQDPVTAARQLRAALLTLVAQDSDESALASLNKLCARKPFHYHFASASAVATQQKGGATLIGTLLQDVAQLFEQGNWGRIKICNNPACISAFYDTTRARTQRWHSYALCGNKANVAAHRSRAV